MKKTVEIALFARFMIAIAAAFSPAAVIAAEIEGDAGGDNHYILECGGHCFNNLVPPTIGPGYTGAWYDPAQSGHGLFIEVLPDNKIQAAWFTFNPAGTEQAWFVGMGSYSGNTATIASVVQPMGGRWVPNFDPDQVVNNIWGALTITFSDADHGRVDFSSMLGYGAGSMNLTRLTNVAAPDARWRPASSPKSARSGHTATLLQDGRVLVAGGTAADPSAELYDPKADTWRLTANMNAWRRGHTATLLQDGRVLIVGGGPQEANAEVYDPATDTWKEVANPASFRQMHTATLLPDGRVLVVGGGVYAAETASAELYDSKAGNWQYTSGLSEGLTGHAANMLRNGKVLVAGGTHDRMDGVGIARARLYDPSLGIWRPAGDLDVPRYDHAVVSMAGGDVMAIGGSDGWSLRSAEVFHPETSTWSRIQDLNTARHSTTATLLPDGSVLVAGGVQCLDLEHCGPTSSAEVYDAFGGRWRPVGDLQIARAGHTATLLKDGRVLVVGGAVELVGDPPSTVTIASAELYATLSPGTISPSLTGSWYDPAQSGHGLFVEVLPNNQFLAAWFTFNPAGTQQAWFIGTGTYSGNTATLTSVVQPTGGRWIPNFDPSRVVNNAWGSLTFMFTDCNHGKVDFVSSLGYGVGSMNLTRLTQPAGHSCP